jgi:signal transduction histidine kinase
MRSLTLRRFMVAALLAGVLLPLAVGLGTWFAVERWQSDQRAAHIREAEQLLRRGRGHFEEVDWQRSADARFRSLGIGLFLSRASPYRKSLAYTTGNVDPTDLKRELAGRKADYTAKELKLPARDGIYVATLLLPPLNTTTRLLAALLAGIGVLGAVLAAVSLLIGRWIVRPLRRLNEYLESIAGGAGDEQPPESRVREVSDVGVAVAAMHRRLIESAERDARTDEERRFLITAVAHDLRTPLFLLRGYLERLARSSSSNGDLPRAQDKARRLDRMIDDLFAFSRIEYRGPELTRQEVDLGGLLEHASAEFGERVEEKRIALSANGPPATSVVGDEHALGRVASNLLDNALRHTPAGGTIDVSWSRDNGLVSFAVRDSGEGIAADDLPHLFEPLYRGDRSRRSSTGGSGLGLAIAKRLVEAHHGTLSARTREEGGAEFVVTIPAP